jgi:hypothetical protein
MRPYICASIGRVEGYLSWSRQTDDWATCHVGRIDYDERILCMVPNTDQQAGISEIAIGRRQLLSCESGAFALRLSWDRVARPLGHSL